MSKFQDHADEALDSIAQTANHSRRVEAVADCQYCDGSGNIEVKNDLLRVLPCPCIYRTATRELEELQTLLNDTQAAQLRNIDTIAEQTKLLAECREMLKAAAIDIEYKRTHSQTKIARMNACNTLDRIKSIVTRIGDDHE